MLLSSPLNSSTRLRPGASLGVPFDAGTQGDVAGAIGQILTKPLPTYAIWEIASMDEAVA